MAGKDRIQADAELAKQLENLRHSKGKTDDEIRETLAKIDENLEGQEGGGK